MYGLIHSIDTFSTLDGPGIRTVIFMQGCHLRCKYCHNPDAWDRQSNKAQEYTIEDLIRIIKRGKPYFAASNGGITFSGGEPLLQYQFIKEVLKKCQQIGIHTAIDTSLYVKSQFVEAIMPYTNLFLADIKHIEPLKSKNLTGMSNELNITNLQLLAKAKIPIWIRYVLVPGLTDDDKDLIDLGHFINNLNTVARIDLLPYHTLGKHKWNLLGIKYELGDIKPPSAEDIKHRQKMLANITNIEVHANV